MINESERLDFTTLNPWTIGNSHSKLLLPVIDRSRQSALGVVL